MSNETQMTAARAGRVTDEIARVARDEFLDPETVRAGVAAGTIAIPCSRNRSHERVFGVGRSLRTKINANIGQSAHSSGIREERDKLDIAVQYGSDMVMDLSTGPGSPDVLTDILRRSPVPVGTVPIYQALTRVDDPMDLTLDGLLAVIEEQARAGVDFMTVHAGLLRGHLPFAKARKAGIVSRGGAILAKWMQVHGRENPLFTGFDRVLDICLAHDVTLSLGDGLRPGCLADASDEAQFAELKVLGDLVRRCRAAGVQAMVEGPGHVPLDQIEMNMRREREECDDAPFYILGPVVADCAPGYDHITAAIGGALGAMHGAAMLCYVTPREHLGLPDAEDVRTGVVAFKLAAHAADVALGRPHARDRDDAISDARVAFDWEKQFALSLDPERARSMHRPAEIGVCAEDGAVCTMCGPKFCSMRISRDLKNSKA